jgi:hypothetical protein
MRKANRKDMSAGVMRCVLANNTGNTQHTALMKCNYFALKSEVLFAEETTRIRSDRISAHSRSLDDLPQQRISRRSFAR